MVAPPPRVQGLRSQPRGPPSLRLACPRTSAPARLRITATSTGVFAARRCRPKERPTAVSQTQQGLEGRGLRNATKHRNRREPNLFVEIAGGREIGHLVGHVAFTLLGDGSKAHPNHTRIDIPKRGPNRVLAFSRKRQLKADSFGAYARLIVIGPFCDRDAFRDPPEAFEQHEHVALDIPPLILEPRANRGAQVARCLRQPIEQLAPCRTTLRRGQGVQHSLVSLRSHEGQQAIQAFDIEGLAREQDAQVRGLNQASQDFLRSRFRAVWRREDQSDERGRLPQGNGLVHRPVHERSASTRLQAHLQDTQRIMVLERSSTRRTPGASGGDREPLQELSVRLRIRIVEGPVRQEPPDLLSEAFGRHRLQCRGCLVGMCRQLREHPQQTMGNRLSARGGRRFHHVECRLGRHALSRVEDECGPLADVAAHLEDSAQRVGTQILDQTRCPSAQGLGLGAR